jgi:cytochrome c-type biogenesis protein CcmH
MSRVLRLSWFAVALVVVAALAVAATGERGDGSNEDRVYRLASSLACPVCQGQSVAESDVPVAREIRAEIRRRVDAGETDDQIRGFLVDIYGEDVDYTPSAEGVTALVWVLPPLVAIASVAGLVLVFRSWRVQRGPTLDEADRELVERARGGQEG